ncbi:MAG: glycosyl transferase family 1 [Hapalosiphonaceae cyanobacterium JJU2]|nr:MAG: glycosyl transferase family 1 [Hapalosiphonaceae cyanobacterium JJU2]
MNLLVALEHRFERTPDGKVWTLTMFPYSFWIRYLEVFDHVRVVACVREVSSVPTGWKRADGEGVSFVAVPYYVGPVQYLWRIRQVQQAIANALTLNDAVILRVSSQIANHFLPILRRNHYPYGVEVVADPCDVFTSGSVRHILRRFLCWLFSPQLRRLCTEACAAAYLTERTLQHRYPPGIKTFSTYFSDVELPNSAFVCLPRILTLAKDFVSLIYVGTMDQLYKAPDVLIEAVARCIWEGLNLKLVLIGDGKHRPELETKAAVLGVGEYVNFLGWLPARNDVHTQLDKADLFILPSHQEGLPRTMVEAMARGLPCIGSTVGAIPELLLCEDLVPPGDVIALARKIREVVTDPQRMARMSVRNLQKAKKYIDKRLREQRIEFYCYIRETTQVWLNEQKQEYWQAIDQLENKAYSTRSHW